MVLPSNSRTLQSTDGTAIFAEATGNPQNLHVVLLAGLTLSGCVFDAMCADQRLLDSLYIVRYDVRGHGRSGKPTTAAAYESKNFADDFKTVMEAFRLQRPILVGWSMGAAVAVDVATHLPPNTLSGVIYLSGVPATSLVAEMAAPPLVSILPGLVSNDSVTAYQTGSDFFVNALFAHPDAVPYAVWCLHRGHSLSPEIMSLSLSRPMDVESLWKAGREGLPLLVVQGTADGHRVGGAKGVDEIMRPHFKDYEIVWLEGRGHALHVECPDEIVQLMIRFAQRVSGKN